MVVGGIVEKANIPFSVKQKPRFSFPLLAALAQKSNRLCRFLANDDDDDEDDDNDDDDKDDDHDHHDDSIVLCC